MDSLGQTEAFICSLRKLHKENLSNLSPHPIFGAFYDSHPTLREKEIAIVRLPSGDSRPNCKGNGENLPMVDNLRKGIR
jgi:hypothetical protein